MGNLLKKYFLPHEGNEFRPHYLRELNVVIVAALILFMLAFSLLYSSVLLRTNLLGAILPGVLVEMTNTDRDQFNAHPLRVSSVLEQAARMKAEDMASKGYFSHTSPEGATPWDWFRKAGYSFTRAGENLAINFVDSADVETAWMNSPGHRANILNQNFTEIGIAMARGMYEGRETIFVVQEFGTPAITQEPVAVINTPPAAVVVNPPAPAPVAVVPPAPKPIAVAVKGEDTVTIPTPASAEAPAGEPAAIPEPSPTPQSAPEPVKTAESQDGNSMFIAVENAPPVVAPEDVSTSAGTWSTALPILKRLATSPKLFMQIIYLLIACQVLLAIGLMIWAEAHQRNPRHVFYGLFLLALLLGSFYIANTFLPGVSVV